VNAVDRETQLWYWLLYKEGLTTARAKSLLETWRTQGITLEAALAALPESALAAGFSDAEIAALRPPERLESVAAIRWNEPLYPSRLLQLEAKSRPALLFYRGDPRLLARPLLVVPPAPLHDAAAALLQEALSQLLGEGMLPAATRGAAQATLLLGELADSEGEALLFVRQGLETLELSPQEQRFLAEGRLLLVSPLHPDATANAKWDASLLQVELGAAELLLWVSATAPIGSLPATRTLWLTPTPPAVTPLPGLQITDEPGEVLLWLSQSGGEPPAPPAEAPLTAPPLPPLPPAEALRILERGGAIPEVLRRRLLEK